jgi:predicted site-specific integrase-resolvase
MIARVRCAIYTRKSSEEGLEQSFNSLDAQREACGAYILSQRHEGWNVVSNRYDDGGYSGGNMERPGLRRLLDDIAAKRVDTVVVYKVDRLTRSLADFAKMVEQFDKQGVSFVSVMGRPTREKGEWMEVTYLRTSSLKPGLRNPRLHSDKQVRQIAHTTSPGRIRDEPIPRQRPLTAHMLSFRQIGNE